MVGPFGRGVVSHGVENDVCVLGEDGRDWGGVDFVAASVKECSDEGKDHVECAVVFRLEHSAESFCGEEAVKSLSAIGGGEVYVESRCRGIFFDGRENGVGVFEDGGADGLEGSLGFAGTDNGEEGLGSESVDCGGFDEFRDAEVEVMQRFEGEDVVRRGKRSDVEDGI